MQATAVRAWTLLLTTVPAWHLEAGWVEARLATLGALLHAPSVAVRASAGEAVSLLYSTCGLASLADAGQQGPAAAPATPASPGSRPPRPRPGGTPRPGGGTEGEEPPTTPGVDLGPRVNGKSVSYSADIRAEPSSGEEESRAEGTSYSAKSMDRKAVCGSRGGGVGVRCGASSEQPSQPLADKGGVCCHAFRTDQGIPVGAWQGPTPATRTHQCTPPLPLFQQRWSAWRTSPPGSRI